MTQPARPFAYEIAPLAARKHLPHGTARTIIMRDHTARADRLRATVGGTMNMLLLSEAFDAMKESM